MRTKSDEEKGQILKTWPTSSGDDHYSSSLAAANMPMRDFDALARSLRSESLASRYVAPIASGAPTPTIGGSAGTMSAAIVAYEPMAIF